MGDNAFGPSTVIQHGVMDEEAKAYNEKKDLSYLRSCASIDQAFLDLKYASDTKVVVCTVIPIVELDVK